MQDSWEINIFGKKLRFEMYELREIRLLIFMDSLEKSTGDKIQKILENMGGFNGLLDNRDKVEKQIRELYANAYKEIFLYIKRLKDPNSIKISDIILDETKNETIFYVCDNFNLKTYIKTKKIEVEMQMRQAGFSEEQRNLRRRSYEKQPYEELKAIFNDYVKSDFCELVDQVEDVLIMNGIDVDPTCRDEEKAKIIFECLKSAENKKEKYEYAFELLKTDATKKEYFEYCMMEFPEELDALMEIYVNVGFSISADKMKKVLSNLFRNLPHDTEEQTLFIKKILDGIQKNVDIKKDPTCLKVRQLLSDFDLKERTYRNMVFQTREQKAEAEKLYNVLDEKYKDIDSYSEEKCKSEKEWIESQEFITQIALIFIGKLDGRIKKIWQDEDQEKFSTLFQNMNIYDEDSKKQAIQIIKVIGKSEDKESYIKAIEAINNENIARFKEYAVWQKKNVWGKYGVIIGFLTGSLILSMFSSVGLMGIVVGCIMLAYQKLKIKKLKENWNTLTINGKIMQKQLLQEINEI